MSDNYLYEFSEIIACSAGGFYSMIRWLEKIIKLFSNLEGKINNK